MADCEQCRAARVLWASFQRRTTALDRFEVDYVTVDSRLGLWLDGRGWYVPRPDVYGLNLSHPAELGRFRRLRNARGENLVGAARIAQYGGRRWWAFPITAHDGDRVELSLYVEPRDAEAWGMVRPSRRGFRLTLYHDRPLWCESDRAAAVQLPATVEIVGVWPAPDFVGVVHDRPTVMWRSGAAYPTYPVVRARWRGGR